MSDKEGVENEKQSGDGKDDLGNKLNVVANYSDEGIPYGNDEEVGAII